jgi:transposase
VLEVEGRRHASGRCGRVKRERLESLADNPFYSKRFAEYIGRRCWHATTKDVAEELRLHWETIKTLEMQYMRAQLARMGTPGPKTIGIDENLIRKGHSYRIDRSAGRTRRTLA